MTISTTEPAAPTTAYGSVDRFAAVLRKYDDLGRFNSALIGLIEHVSDARFNTDTETATFVRNVLAAADVVRAEQAGDRA